jgi:toxin CptA
MQIVLASAVFVMAAACAGLMGFAIQRGATCTVAAVDEIVRRRALRRLAAMGEASIWVLGGLAIAQTLRVLPALPAGAALTAATVVGGALLGVGAYVNGACVFGAIARLGSGEWAYAATPLGFYAGCVAFANAFPNAGARVLPHPSPLLAAAPGVAAVFVAFAAWRLGRAFAGAGDPGPPGRGLRAAPANLWSPHAATAVIGVTFVLLLLLVGGAWAYTDVLAELARGMAANVFARGALLIALFTGALAGGWTAGRFRSTAISFAQLARCVSGGALMGWGSLWIPGSNDGLILVGMPLLRPYAWVAFATMCVAIGAAMRVRDSLAQRRERAAAS